MTQKIPEIHASNAFYYYTDLKKAWTFYQDILGFETAADYGFAKIMRVAGYSYLTLVDAKFGMHKVEEPKSVTLAMVTEQVAAWYDYLISSGVPIHRKFEIVPDSAHDGFVALDPEGYFLEFEIFNPHPENNALMPFLSELETTYTSIGSRPKGLGIQATVLWLYYRDLNAAQKFHEGLLGAELLVDQGWAKVYPVSSSGFVGFVDGEHGLHKSATQKCVTVSFFTNDVNSWFQRAAAWEGFKLHTPEITYEGEHVRLFVGIDPEGYFFEWDTFLAGDENDDLLRHFQTHHK